MSNIKYLPVKHSKLVDCFWGKGWKNWARIRTTEKKPILIESSHFTVPNDVWGEIVGKFTVTQ